MSNFKLFLLINALLIIVNGQMSFAQTNHKCFDFECGSTCEPQMDETSYNDVLTYNGRPQVRSDCPNSNSTKSLRLRYFYCPGSPASFGFDGVLLKYSFDANKNYRISYRIASSRENNLPFEINFRMIPGGSAPTPRLQGNISEQWAPTCGNTTYALPNPANSVQMGRLSTGNPTSFNIDWSTFTVSSIPGNYTPDNSCSFSQPLNFTYQAPQSGSYMYIRLEQCGWTYPNIQSRADIWLDDICIEEICAPNTADFKLKVIGTTRTNTNRQTQNRFNFEIEPVQQGDNTIYRIDVYRSQTQSDNTNFQPSSICTLTSPSSGWPTIKFNTRDDPNHSRGDDGNGDRGFLDEESGSGTCFFYRIRLTVSRCGQSASICRVVKVCYNGNIPVNTTATYNLSYDFIVSDDAAGSGRTRTLVATGRPANAAHNWVSGLDNNQFGNFSPSSSGPSTSNIHVQTLPALNSVPEFLRLQNSLVSGSTTDALVLFDRFEPNCNGNPSLQRITPNSTALKPTNFNTLSIYPNPTSESTAIQYYLSQSDKVNIYLTDIMGRNIRQLVQNEERKAGNYEVVFARKGIENGVYFVVMENAQGKVVKKLILN
jgi:hypothetical protein